MENRTARQICFVAAMLGVPSLSMGQVQAPAVRLVDPASIRAQQLSAAQLSDLVAPIALYPDALLSQVLVASTYPLEVVQAQQWLQRNGSLQGQELMDAARRQPWDASVQGLVAFPDAMATLNEDIQWTTALGSAFLAQEADVMVAVQDLRSQAQVSGRLVSSPQQTVSAVAGEGRTVIEIVPADPQVIYVPRYDPYYVWGSPAWGAYPPLSYGYGYGFGLGINVGFWFGGWSWGLGWGWGPNWYGGSVYVNSAFFRHCGYNYGHHGAYYGGSHGGHTGGYGGGHGSATQARRQTWKHDSGHRMGVPYGNGRGSGPSRGGSQASRSTLTGPGSSSRRSGSLAAAYSGSRATSSGSRGAGTDQGWRTGNGSIASGLRGGGADRGWSASGVQRRPSEALSGRQVLSPRGPASSPRSSISSYRGSAPSNGYSAPSRPRSSQGPTRSFSSSGPSRSLSSPAPSRGYQVAPRSSPSIGSGRSAGAGSSQRSGGGGSRGTVGSSRSSGGSHGGGRRH